MRRRRKARPKELSGWAEPFGCAEDNWTGMWDAARAVMRAVRGGACLVAFRVGGDRIPLFFVHGRHGNVLRFARYAEDLGPEQPFYALQPRGLNGIDEPDGSLAAMAERYLGEVRQVRPAGPYALGGFCVGGVVAFEMAQRLMETGEEVSELVLVDTVNPEVVAARGETGLWKKFRRRARVTRTGALRMALRAGEHELVRLAVAGLAPVARRLGLREPAAIRARIVPAAMEDAARYRPRPYRGHVTLICSEFEAKRYPDRGWAGVVEGGLTVRRMAGAARSESLVRGETGRAAGRAMRAALDAAMARRGAGYATVTDGSR